MKKNIILIAISILTFAGDIFAQNPVEVKSMDMNEYASWAGLFVIFMIFSMFALFLIFSSEEGVPVAVIPVPQIVMKRNFADLPGQVALPVVTIDTKAIRLTLISSLIISAVVLLLMILK